MQFDHNKRDAERFAYSLNVLGKIKGMSDGQSLEHCK